jgi:hypothetical protein
MSDEYRRGAQVAKERERPPPVRSLYRPVVLLVWLTGIPILLVATYLFGPVLGFVVVGVVHIFVAGMLWADIRALRQQNLEWGLSRHLWFGAAVGLPLVGPAYYLYAGRKIDAENRRRGYDVDGAGGAADAGDVDDAGEWSDPDDVDDPDDADGAGEWGDADAADATGADDGSAPRPDTDPTDPAATDDN